MLRSTPAFAVAFAAVLLPACFSEEGGSGDEAASHTDTSAAATAAMTTMATTNSDDVTGSASASMTGSSSGDATSTATTSDDSGSTTDDAATGGATSTTTTGADESSTTGPDPHDGIDDPYAHCDINCDVNYWREGPSFGCVCAPPCTTDDDCPEPGACVDANEDGDYRCMIQCFDVDGCTFERRADLPTVCAFDELEGIYACMHYPN